MLSFSQWRGKEGSTIAILAVTYFLDGPWPTAKPDHSLPGEVRLNQKQLWTASQWKSCWWLHETPDYLTWWDSEVPSRLLSRKSFFASTVGIWHGRYESKFWRISIAANLYLYIVRRGVWTPFLIQPPFLRSPLLRRTPTPAFAAFFFHHQCTKVYTNRQEQNKGDGWFLRR